MTDLVEEKDPAKWKEMGFADGEVQTGRVWIWKYDLVLPSVEEVEQLNKSK